MNCIIESFWPCGDALCSPGPESATTRPPVIAAILGADDEEERCKGKQHGHYRSRDR